MAGMWNRGPVAKALTRALCGVLSVVFLVVTLPAHTQEARTPPTPRLPAASAQAAMAGGVIAVVQPATATELALAMDIPANSLVSATIGTSDPRAVAVGTTALGGFFPRIGGSFAILSTGLASDAEKPNNSPSTSTELSGLVNSQGRDLVQLRLVLKPPPDAKCLAVDFAFYSEEFPEFVGSQFNDAFIAEIGGSTFQIQGNKVVAPLNFAFDTDGNVISVNTVFGVTSPTQTTYDGVTPLLRAVAPLKAEHFPTVEVVFSITDLGDSIYDSTVFLDNFAWVTTPNCAAGASLVATAISPPSGVYTRSQRFDLLLFERTSVTGRTGSLNGVDVSGFLTGCKRGFRLDGPAMTARCPGLSGALLEGVFGPGPYSLRVTLTFTDKATLTDTVTWEIPRDAAPPVLTLSPPSGAYASTQQFDLVLVVKSPSLIVGGMATLDNIDVTAGLSACLGKAPLEALPGAGLALRCPDLAGSVVGSGSHTVSVTVNFADGTSATDTVTWNVKPNVEPITPFSGG